MKKLSLIILGLFLTGGSTVSAAELRSGERYVLPQGEALVDDLYAAGGDVSLNGTVTGDATAASGNIVFKGAVSQDALFAGGTVIIDGSVADDLRVVGGTVTLSGSVGGDMAVAGGTLHLISGSSVGGDLLVAGGTVIIDGSVVGQVRLAGGNAVISGSVGGDVWSYAEQLTLSSTAKVAGDVTNRSINEVTVDAGATVGGKVIHDPAMVQPRDFRGFVAAGNTIGFIIMLFAGLLCFWLFKNRSSQLVAHALAHFWKETLRGLILIIALPIVGVALLISLLGAPVGGIILLLFFVVFILAKVFAGIMLGGWINKVVFKKPDQIFTWQTIIGGNVVLLLLDLLPVVGGIISIIFFLVGFGAFWGYLYRHFWVHR